MYFRFIADTHNCLAKNKNRHIFQQIQLRREEVCTSVVLLKMDKDSCWMLIFTELYLNETVAECFFI